MHENIYKWIVFMVDSDVLRTGLSFLSLAVLIFIVVSINYSANKKAINNQTLHLLASTTTNPVVVVRYYRLMHHYYKIKTDEVGTDYFRTNYIGSSEAYFD